VAEDTGDHVVVTYRQIAEHFRLGSTRAARTKAQRAGWEIEPANHPADPRRIRVPRSLWDQAADPSRDQEAEPVEIESPQSADPWEIKRRSPRDQRHDGPMIRDLDALLAPFQEQFNRERTRADSAEARVVQLVVELQKIGEGRAAAEATAKARLEEIERLSGLLNAGLLARLRDFFLAIAREGGFRPRLPKR
jgi:hypothetical protein